MTKSFHHQDNFWMCRREGGFGMHFVLVLKLSQNGHAKKRSLIHVYKYSALDTGTAPNNQTTRYVAFILCNES